MCPICALHHTRAAHRCQNPTCPRSGNNRPVSSCCPTSPPHCCNRGNDHTATFKKCPARPDPARPARRTSPVPPGQDAMDMAVDGGAAPSTPPAMEGPTEVGLLTPRQPPPADLRALVLFTALAVLSPWRPRALPPPLLTLGFVLEMNKHPPLDETGLALIPNLLSIVQHNCLGSWDVFLSLFTSFQEAATYPSFVFLQDPPVSKAHLPSFNGFKSFLPPVRKP